MKDNTFAMAMGKIVAEAEAEQAAEVRAQRRHRILDRIRSVVKFMVVVAALFFAFHYRAKLQSLLLSKIAPQTSNGPSASIKAAQDNAAARDKVVDDITK